MSDQPIGEHAMLSDCHSAALVDRSGSVEWWCTPRFDSPSVFARLLDTDGGHFSITPRRIEEVRREYQEGSLVLRTLFTTESGRVELLEGLAMAEGVRGHELGRQSPHVLLRVLRCLDGGAEVDIEFAPRFEYGLTAPLLRPTDNGIIARGGPVTLCLSTTVDLELEGSAGAGSAVMNVGESLAFAVEGTSSWGPLPEPWTAESIEERLEDTVAAWQSWGAEHQRYQGPYEDEVMLSGRILQGLTYQPTGAMVAAPTTSLPETVGGERNWDYRYCWVRDAGFTLRALWVAACPDEADVYLDYLTTSASSVYERGQLQIMFGIRGSRDLSERAIPWLSGWRASAPVRIGNAAWQQPQHDVYGELLSAAHRLKEQLGDLDDTEKRLLVFLADRAAEVWKMPDHGIWEIRGEPRHYLHSKLMCWVALDRAIDLAESLGVTDRLDTWKKGRDAIRRAILDEGWDEETGCFTQSFGSDALDASVLLLPIVGFLPFDDHRVKATVHSVRDHLVDERGLVHRYLADDGLPGEEGAFLLCSFWLAEALAGMGQIDEARGVFETVITHGNDVGLFSEEVDPVNGEMLGNFPQAFSHVGLVNAAWAISGALEGTDPAI